MAEEAAEQPPSPSKSKIKEMRRIAERTESPTDKTELVNYLNERIKQAEVSYGLSRTPSTILRNF